MGLGGGAEGRTLKSIDPVYIYTGSIDLRVRPSAPPPKPIPVVVRFPKFFRTVKYSQINEA